MPSVDDSLADPGSDADRYDPRARDDRRRREEEDENYRRRYRDDREYATPPR
jgi:hypothetical protein